MRRVLVTGGTGSFGRAFVRRLLESNPDIERLVIFSRDELKQWEMSQLFSSEIYPQIRYFLGDIRDKDRLKLALERIDTVVHAAALKQVPAAEYNPIEFIKTNVIGTENLVQCCLDSNVERMVALSTDKAAAPINLYGATKLCADKLCVAANNMIGLRNLTFSVVRYGNVMGSRGSVIPFFLKQAKGGTLSITHTDMTRFNISLSQGVEMVCWAIENSLGGEIFVPKIPSYRIIDVANAIAPTCKHEITGIRPGEKMHEEMITSSDSHSTIDLGQYFAILPSDLSVHNKYKAANINFSDFEKGYSYASDSNSHFLTVEELRSLIRENVDPTFSPI